MLTSSQTPFRIFVSHSHLDNDFGIKLVDHLKQALAGNCTIWYDSHGGLHGGDAWWEKIREELRSCNVFIVILSPDAVASSWVNSEIDIAWRHKLSKASKVIIPVLYRECDVRDDLSTLQIISFLPPQTYPSALSDLLTALGAVTSQIPGHASHIITSPQQSSPSPAKRLRIKPMVFVGLILAFLIVASSLGFFYFKGNSNLTPMDIHTINTRSSGLTPADVYATATSGNPTINDPLNSSVPSNWLQYNNGSYGCQFTGNAYYAWAEQPGLVTHCSAVNVPNFSNFALQVQMTIVSGDAGGLIFRNNGTDQYRLNVGPKASYNFIVTVNGDTGHGADCCEMLASGSSQAINQGLNQTNILTVVARGSDIYLYINGKYVNHVIDTHISFGQIGLFAYAFSQPTGVDFSNLKVWTL